MTSAATLPTSIRLPSSSTNVDTVTSLHLLPFRVQYSGPARIKGYFAPTEHASLSQATHNGTAAPLQRAYFRGRMLLGSEIRLPHGYAGQVWKSNGPTISSLPSQQQQQQQRQAQTPRPGTHAHIADPVYGPDSPRRSPRKQAAASASAADAGAGAPPAKRLKLDGTVTSSAGATQKQQVKKQKVKKKRETFDMSPDLSPVKKVEQPVDEPLELDALPVQGLPMLVDDEGKEGTAMLAATHSEESGDVTAVPPTGSPTKQDVGSAKGAAENKADEPVKLEDAIEEQNNTEQNLSASMPRASTPPPSTSSSAPISLPCTPAGHSKPLVLNIATPKPFAAPAVDDNDDGVSGGHRGEAITERLLQPIAEFKAFTVWNPDTEVDAGEDAYIRALAEWTKLAALVRPYRILSDSMVAAAHDRPVRPACADPRLEVVSGQSMLGRARRFIHRRCNGCHRRASIWPR